MIKAKKNFGQNFLTDKNLLNAICMDAGVCADDDVLEIGAGMGGLTIPLCQKAKKVVAYEIDQDLKEILLNLDQKNLILHFEDALKKDLKDLESDFEGKYKLVANLPYYITTPLIFKFLASEKLISMTIMVQKEVAQRMCAKPNERDYGLLSVSCAFYGQAKIMRNVSRQMFHPSPDVDSAIVRLDIHKQQADEKLFMNIVKLAFNQKRKMLLNTLSDGLNVSKQELQKLPFDFSRRPEELSMQDFLDLCQILQSNR